MILRSFLSIVGGFPMVISTFNFWQVLGVRKWVFRPKIDFFSCFQPQTCHNMTFWAKIQLFHEKYGNFGNPILVFGRFQGSKIDFWPKNRIFENFWPKIDYFCQKWRILAQYGVSDRFRGKKFQKNRFLTIFRVENRFLG